MIILNNKVLFILLAINFAFLLIYKIQLIKFFPKFFLEQFLKTSVNIKSLGPILMQAGMPGELVSSSLIEPVSEGCLSITFKITLPSREAPFFLKFSEIEGAKGGPFLKHLIPMNQSAVREHAKKRRCFVRKILDSVIAYYRPTLIPRPCYFDLSSDTMKDQKIKARERVFTEYRITDSCIEPLLVHTVATLWKGLNLEHFPLSSPEKTNIWDVTSYSPKILFECLAALAELQTQADLYLQTYQAAKVAKGRNFSDVNDKIEKKLSHEQKALLGYHFIRSDFLSSFDLSDLSLIEEALSLKGEKLAHLVNQQIEALSGSSIEQLQAQFLDKHPIALEEASKYALLPFNKLIFTAEKERWWSCEIINEAKKLARLEQARAIAESLKTQPKELSGFIQWLLSFEMNYLAIESMPKGLVHQDPSPVNLLRNLDDHNISLIDLEDLSWDIRIADISFYIFSVLKAVDSTRIIDDDAFKMIEAILTGYQSQIKTPLSQKELNGILEYRQAMFLNFLPQFGMIVRLADSELDLFNLAMSLDDFFTQFKLHQRVCQLWSEKFLPRFMSEAAPTP